MADMPPLLPTPPNHQRLRPEIEQQNACKRDWDRQKVEIIEMYLDEKADKWFQGVKLGKPKLSWVEFGDLLCKRFADSICKDVVEEFNKLRQEGSIEEYQEKFEELKPLMLIKIRNLDENYFISNFISGLKEEIKPMIRMLKPATLVEAFELSQWQEYSLKVQNKHSKENFKLSGENRFGISRGNTSALSSNTYRVPANNTVKTSRFSNRLQEDSGELKKISAQELQYRRSKGLCFKCGEKYSIGHQCALGHVNCMILEEEEDAAFEDAMENKMNKLVTQGILDGEKVFMLVDTGSSDCYINSEKVIGMNIDYKWVEQPFSVIMGNGTTVTSNAICPNVHWRINQHNFKFDLKVIELDRWDIILGVDWMTHFSPITFDFQQLRISLHHEGSEIHLHGQAEDCEMDLIRGKDLRTFIEYKRQMCMTLNCKGESEGKEEIIPQRVRELLQEFEDVFQTPSSLPPSRSVDHAIHLKPDAQPFKLKPYRYPHCHKEEIEKQVTEMLQKGIVKYNNSPFASPILLVKKKEGTWRFCVDYRSLNELTIKDRFPIPNVDELLDELAGSVYKTKLGLTAGYHQIRVKSQDTFKTAFQTHCGYFEFLVMSFGLTNAPATFQSLMNQVF
ncbi:uncharacterized protein [Coffea arabica]|uniref:Reverse transcriptase domain-containing protein n=1 Tax=Coffea arabica TaxID=13443 RepID=A0A6P6WZW4_COFAR